MQHGTNPWLARFTRVGGYQRLIFRTQIELWEIGSAAGDLAKSRVTSEKCEACLGEGAFPEFSQSVLLTTAFEDEDEYEMPNAKREALENRELSPGTDKEHRHLVCVQSFPRKVFPLVDHKQTRIDMESLAGDVGARFRGQKNHSTGDGPGRILPQRGSRPLAGRGFARRLRRNGDCRREG